LINDVQVQPPQQWLDSLLAALSFFLSGAITMNTLTLAQVQHVSGGKKPNVELSAELKAALSGGSSPKPSIEATIKVTIKF
jgi:hypothetical protein